MSVISSSLRKEYTQSKLMETDLESHPFDQFHKWFNDAVSAELPLPNAMTLATVKKDQTPAARVVLLKELDQREKGNVPNITSSEMRKVCSQNLKLFEIMFHCIGQASKSTYCEVLPN